MRIVTEKSSIKFKTDNGIIEFGRTAELESLFVGFYENDSGHVVTLSPGKKKGLICPVHPKISSVDVSLNTVRVTVQIDKNKEIKK